MASKDDINKTAWQADSVEPYRLDEQYYNSISNSEICSSPPLEVGRSSLQANGDLCRSPNRVWEELRAAQDSETLLSTDVDLLRKEMADLKGKNTAMYKAVIVLQGDNQQLKDDVQALRKAFSKGGLEAARWSEPKTRSASTTADLQEENQRLKSTINTLQNTVQKLQEDVKSLQDHNGGIFSVFSEAKVDVETRTNKLKELSAQCQSDIADLKSRIDANEKATGTKPKNTVTHTGIHCDVCRKGPIVGTRYKCTACSDYDLCETCYQKKSHAHHAMIIFKEAAVKDEVLREKVCKPVAFTADLRETARSRGGTLICDRVISSVGKGYDETTGVFTAPKSGTYFFVLTVSPNGASDAVVSSALIVCGEDHTIGMAYAEGSGWSTGHAVATLEPGNTVRLKVPANDQQYVFKESFTTFSGFLLQGNI